MPIKSDAQRRAVAKYNKSKYDQIAVRVPAGRGDRIRAHAAARGESVNGFINRCIDETMERDGAE